MSHISADVTLLKSMELNQKKKNNGPNRSLSICLGAEYPSSSEPITVVFVCQLDPKGYFTNVCMHMSEKFGIAIIIHFVLK